MCFHLVKEDFVLKKHNGFTLIEVTIAVSILFSTIVILLPLISLLQTERQVLSDRRMIAYKLHDELQPYLWGVNSDLPSHFEKKIESKTVQFSMVTITESSLLKGCAKWNNAKQTKEVFCLFGKP